MPRLCTAARRLAPRRPRHCLAIAAAAVGGLSLLALLETRRAQRQETAVRHFQNLGATFWYDSDFDNHGPRNSSGPPPTPRWLLGCTTPHFLVRVESMVLTAKGVCDEDLAPLAGVNSLRDVSLDCNPLTNDGLRHLAGLADLRELSLSHTPIDGGGLQWLSRLTRLESLNLNRTGVGDRGLAHLSEFSDLVVLKLAGTNVTDRGLANLRGLTRLQLLSLNGTCITDEGLRMLRHLDRLESLDLSGTRVTPAGVRRLQASLPRCLITTNFLRSPMKKSGIIHPAKREVGIARRTPLWHTPRPHAQRVRRVQPQHLLDHAAGQLGFA